MSKLRRENPHALKINQLKYRPSSPLKHYVTKFFPETFRSTYPEYPLVPHRPLSSTHGPRLFSTQNPSVQHERPFSSTHLSVKHIPQFNTPLSSTHPYVQQGVFSVELRLCCVEPKCSCS